MQQCSDAVVALGSDAIPAARHYAQLTGRPTFAVRDETCLSENEFSTVVATADRITPHLLENLYGNAHDFVPGLIIAPNACDLIATAANLAARIIQYPTWPNEKRQAIWLNSYREATNTRGGGTISSILEHNIDLLWISGHSDGIDASLPEQSVLCPLNESSLEVRQDERTSTCLKTGCCYRLGLPVQSALMSRQLIRASTLRAHVVVAEVCRGIRLSLTSEEYEQSLAWALFGKGQIAALVAPWTTFVGTEADFEPLRKYISQGYRISHAVALFNRQVGQTNPGIRLAILGDATVVVDARAVALHQVPSRVDCDAYLTEPVDLPMNTPLVADVLSSGCAYYHSWTAHARHTGGARYACEYCFSPSIQYNFACDIGGRTLCICPICGVTADMAEGFGGGMILTTPNGLELALKKTVVPGQIGVRLGCKDNSLEKSWLSRIDSSTNTIRFNIEDEWPPGWVKVSVVLEQAGRISVLSREVRDTKTNPDC